MAMGSLLYFAESIETLADTLREVRPTLFLGVPRVWEKFEAALRANLGQKTGNAKRVVDFGMASELAAFDVQVERGLRSHIAAARQTRHP